MAEVLAVRLRSNERKEWLGQVHDSSTRQLAILRLMSNNAEASQHTGFQHSSAEKQDRLVERENERLVMDPEEDMALSFRGYSELPKENI